MKAFIFAVCVMIIDSNPQALAQSSAQPSSAELDSVKSDLEHVKAELAEVKGQINQLMQIILKRTAAENSAHVPPASVSTSIADSPLLGRKDAPVTLVEFSDFQCSFCQRFFTGTLPALKHDYIDTGKVRFVFKDYPLEQMHSEAAKAAEAAHCSGDQGQYWQMHDQLFRNQQALSLLQLSAYAGALGLNTEVFETCLKSGKYTSFVNKQESDGNGAGFRGTPGFILARSTSDSVVQGTAIYGAQPVAVFRALIDDLLHGTP